jgi:hypothetical protein
LLEDFNANVGREDILKPTVGNESLHGIGNDNGVRVVNSATSKNLTVKSTMFPQHNIHKVTWTSPDGKTHNQIDNILKDRRQHLKYLMSDRTGQQNGDKRNAYRILVGKPEETTRKTKMYVGG